MPEVRASLTVQLHRKLKAEAAREGLYLKELIAKILQEHVEKGPVKINE
jgi:predicted HicB family RNase H-like nuclease